MSNIIEIIQNFNTKIALKNIFSKINEIVYYINNNSGGTVTDVTASAPLNSTGGDSPNLTIDLADSSNDGYLSSTDWNTFNNKENALGFTPENVANKSIDGTLSLNSDTLYPSQKAVKTYADGLVTGLLDDRGNYDASSNLFPSTGGSGIAGAILKGDLWYIDTPGTLGGTSVVIGSSVRALADTPGQTSTNWSILNAGLGYIPENSANKGIPNGYASLDGTGKVLASELPTLLFYQTVGHRIFSQGASVTLYYGSFISENSFTSPSTPPLYIMKTGTINEAMLQIRAAPSASTVQIQYQKNGGSWVNFYNANFASTGPNVTLSVNITGLSISVIKGDLILFRNQNSLSTTLSYGTLIDLYIQ